MDLGLDLFNVLKFYKLSCKCKIVARGETFSCSAVFFLGADLPGTTVQYDRVFIC